MMVVHTFLELKLIVNQSKIQHSHNSKRRKIDDFKTTPIPVHDEEEKLQHSYLPELIGTFNLSFVFPGPYDVNRIVTCHDDHMFRFI